MVSYVKIVLFTLTFIITKFPMITRCGVSCANNFFVFTKYLISFSSNHLIQTFSSKPIIQSQRQKKLHNRYGGREAI